MSDNKRMVTLEELSIFVPIIVGIVMPIVMFVMMQSVRSSAKRGEEVDTQLRQLWDKANQLSASLQLFEWRLGKVEQRINGVNAGGRTPI